jgi:hypothetical protein
MAEPLRLLVAVVSVAMALAVLFGEILTTMGGGLTPGQIRSIAAVGLRRILRFCRRLRPAFCPIELTWIKGMRIRPNT